MSEQGRKWVLPGIFQATLPDSWRYRDVDGLLEFVPTSNVGALHIRVLDRKLTDAPNKAEAAALVSQFAKNHGAAVSPLCVSYSPALHTATASFTGVRGDAPLHWEVWGYVWRSYGLVGSYVHDGKHASERSQAISILESITPTPEDRDGHENGTPGRT